MENFWSYRAHKVKLWRKMRKIGINRPFSIFSSTIDLLLKLSSKCWRKRKRQRRRGTSIAIAHFLNKNQKADKIRP